jgi:hypothetical protein
MKIYLVVRGLEREEENSLKNGRSEINLSIVMILTTKITKFDVKGFYMMRREFYFLCIYNNNNNDNDNIYKNNYIKVHIKKKDILFSLNINELSVFFLNMHIILIHIYS